MTHRRKAAATFLRLCRRRRCCCSLNAALKYRPPDGPTISAFSHWILHQPGGRQQAARHTAVGRGSRNRRQAQWSLHRGGGALLAGCSNSRRLNSPMRSASPLRLPGSHRRAHLARNSLPRTQAGRHGGPQSPHLSPGGATWLLSLARVPSPQAPREATAQQRRIPLTQNQNGRRATLNTTIRPRCAVLGFPSLVRPLGRPAALKSPSRSLPNYRSRRCRRHS